MQKPPSDPPASTCDGMQADAIFMSPPWGGPGYARDGLFDLERPFPGLGVGLKGLIQAARQGLQLCRTGDGQDFHLGTLAIFLPRNANRQHIGAAIPEGVQWPEVVEESVDGFPKGITLYLQFGEPPPLVE